MSVMKKPRPCVPTMSSPSRGWIARSYTGCVGMFPFMSFQVFPPSIDT